jgi:hypothetical protein
VTTSRLAAFLLGLALVVGPAAATIFGTTEENDATVTDGLRVAGRGHPAMATSPVAGPAAREGGPGVAGSPRGGSRADGAGAGPSAPSLAGPLSLAVPLVSGGVVKVRAGSGGSPLSAVVPGERQHSDGGAVVGGLASYVSRSYGSRYLALPGGPGIRVTICSRGRCVRRTSTDAGPSKAMQRAGRVADLSFRDFAFLCRCQPSAVGLIVVSVQYRDELPATDSEELP